MLKGLEAFIYLSLLLIVVSKISIDIRYLTVFFKLCQMYFLLLDSLILLEFILIGIGRSLSLLPIRRKGTVSFTDMCHPNMSGGKQRPIRHQGRCHHWPLKKKIPVNGRGENHSQGKRSRANDGNDLVVGLVFVFHHSCRGGTFQWMILTIP